MCKTWQFSSDVLLYACFVNGMLNVLSENVAFKQVESAALKKALPLKAELQDNQPA